MGWDHFGGKNEPGAGPWEIMRCDDCFTYGGKNAVATDIEAILKHRIDCGCDWPEYQCRGKNGWSGDIQCGEPMIELEPFLWVCKKPDCMHKEDVRSWNQPKAAA